MILEILLALACINVRLETFLHRKMTIICTISTAQVMYIAI